MSKFSDAYHNQDPATKAALEDLKTDAMTPSPSAQPSPTDMERARKLLASVFDALNLNPCVVNGANYHRATEVVSEALTLARQEALEDAAKAVEEVGRDWRDNGQPQKRYASEYLAKHIRPLSSQPTTPAPGKGMTREFLMGAVRGVTIPVSQIKAGATLAIGPKGSEILADAILAKLKGKG